MRPQRDRAIGYVLVLIVFSVLLAACEDNPQWEAVPLPVLPEGTIELSVVNVVNDRFPQLSHRQVLQILKKTTDLVDEHFDLKVRFRQLDTMPIENFFQYLKGNVKRARQKDIIKFRYVSDEDRINMQEGVYRRLTSYWNDREVVADYARPYLIGSYEGNDFRQLAKALVDTLLSRLQFWRFQNARDGLPVINDKPYNEWVWWDSIGYGEMPYDLVITNQIVASAETYDMSVHSTIRGGITAGTTTYSKIGQFNAYAYIMVYPMLNNSDLLVYLRNDQQYSSEQITTYAAALLTHEIGHLLLLLGHPFGNQNCIMSPTPLLKYREWYEGLDVSKCPLNSEENMTPGIAEIDYRADW